MRNSSETKSLATRIESVREFLHRGTTGNILMVSGVAGIAGSAFGCLALAEHLALNNHPDAIFLTTVFSGVTAAVSSAMLFAGIPITMTSGRYYGIEKSRVFKNIIRTSLVGAFCGGSIFGWAGNETAARTVANAQREARLPTLPIIDGNAVVRKEGMMGTMVGSVPVIVPFSQKTAAEVACSNETAGQWRPVVGVDGKDYRVLCPA